ncbi:methylcobamide:CoM methyltransferase MtbA [Tepidibacter aestuarii]|uniref:methylcobamide:CoM methyltransferase MtbA n=1 Tax=Tepidibacter aestuarii TaxID=2925782 RepID=UPI0020BE798C|nr:methylcobamide:CoM methyltransferase MtbA [Tepidibacter aestuarii]CAH2214557.1 [methyl-Co(III) methanol-specific corrinoid protein]:coenzyme M methyltransferase [Tepidibacter aestuarii]
MLTPKERLYNTLKGNEVDRPPCICPGGMMNMIIEDVMDITGVTWPNAHTDAQMMADLTEGIYENKGFENFGVPFCMTVEAEAMGAKVYMGTKVNEPRVIEYPIESVTDWEKLKSINLNEGRSKVVLDAIKILKQKDKDVPIIANLTGPISLASSLMEPTIFYKQLRKKPKEAHEFMEFVTQNLIEFGRAQLEAGADVLTISDPSGTGELLGPKIFREFAVPYLNEIINSLREIKDKGTIIHICGRLKSIYNELNILNSDAISFDSITSVTKVVENVTNKVFMGNVSTFALENNTPEKLKSISNICLENGVDILSPACGIGPRTKLENIQAIVEAAKMYKK